MAPPPPPSLQRHSLLTLSSPDPHPDQPRSSHWQRQRQRPGRCQHGVHLDAVRSARLDHRHLQTIPRARALRGAHMHMQMLMLTCTCNMHAHACVHVPLRAERTRTYASTPRACTCPRTSTGIHTLAWGACLDVPTAMQATGGTLRGLDMTLAQGGRTLRFSPVPSHCLARHRCQAHAMCIPCTCQAHARPGPVHPKLTVLAWHSPFSGPRHSPKPRLTSVVRILTYLPTSPLTHSPTHPLPLICDSLSC